MPKLLDTRILRYLKKNDNSGWRPARQIARNCGVSAVRTQGRLRTLVNHGLIWSDYDHDFKANVYGITPTGKYVLDTLSAAAEAERSRIDQTIEAFHDGEFTVAVAEMGGWCVIDPPLGDCSKLPSLGNGDTPLEAILAAANQSSPTPIERGDLGFESLRPTRQDSGERLAAALSDLHTVVAHLEEGDGYSQWDIDTLQFTVANALRSATPPTPIEQGGEQG